MPAQDGGDVLFTEAGDLPARLPESPTWIRSRSVDVRLEKLFAAQPGDSLELNLFEDSVVIAEVRWAGYRKDLSWGVRAKILDQKQAHVVLEIVGRAVAGTVTLADAVYEIRYLGEGRHRISQLDLSALPPELPPTRVDSVDEDSLSEELPVVQSPRSKFEVLVVYTPAVKAAEGGEDGVKALVNLARAETNQALNRSQVDARITTLGPIEVAYTETGDLRTDRNRLKRKSDGFMDEVHTARDIYGADQVLMLVNQGDGCGIAFLLSSQSQGTRSKAFSVARNDCVSPNYTFAHELGHNWGLNHARDDPTGDGAYRYSYGHKNFDAGFRTVMAYDCSEGFCRRFRNFSNPDVLVRDEPSGVPTSNRPEAAHNARSVERRRTQIESWTARRSSPNFNSGFQLHSSGWYETSGGWKLNALGSFKSKPEEQGWSAVAYKGNYATFDYEARVKRRGCSTCSVRVLLDGVPFQMDGMRRWRNAVALQYSNNGKFSVYRLKDGQFSAIKNWTSSSAIKTGGTWNRLRVLRRNAITRYYINGTLVWEGDIDIGVSDGIVGLGFYAKTSATSEKMWIDWARLTKK